MVDAYLDIRNDWSERLRQICLGLFAILPAMLLFWRGGAEVVISLIGVSYLTVVVARRAWHILLNPAVAALLATWVILNLLVSPLAIDTGISFSRSLLWVRFAMLFAAVTTWLVQSRRDVKLIMMAWAAAVGFAIVDSLIQLVRGVSLTGRPIASNRLTGPLDRPNIGMFVARIGFPLLVAAAFLLARTGRGLASRVAGIAVAVMIGFGFILLTGERSASLLTLLAIVTSAGIAALLAPAGFRLYGLLLVMAIVGVLVGVGVTSERVMDRIESLVQTLDSFWTSDYGQLFIGGVQVWREFPLTGAGMKNFQIACHLIMGNSLTSGCHPHPHNIYIEWLAETGIVGSLGFFVFLMMLGKLCFDLLRGDASTRIVGALTVGSFALLLFPVIASQSFFSNWPAILMWASLSMTAATARLMLRTPPRGESG